jgi:hypothetical protein
MSGLPADRNAPFAGWTPELIEASSASYQAEQEALDRIRHEAYAEGRKDEREHWEKIGAVTDCPSCGGAGERMASFIEGPYGYKTSPTARTARAPAMRWRIKINNTGCVVACRSSRHLLPRGWRF